MTANSGSAALLRCVDDDRLCRLTLSRIGEPGDVHLTDVIARLGVADTLRGIVEATLDHPSLPHWRTRLSSARPEHDLEAGRRLGARFVVPSDPQWPAQLDDLVLLPDGYGGVPLGLWVRGRGDLAAASARAVSVVGSRASSAYGDYVAGELSIGLVERGWAVVSGGAFGIDASAHRGALAAASAGADVVATIAVLACGVDVAYPRGNATLIERIAASGLVVSEWPPGCAPLRHRFLVRNRVIAALTAGTVVVEAAPRSGALSTANRARELGRHLMAVPGPVTSEMSRGTNRLLKEPDVACVTDAADVIELVGAIGADLAPEPIRPADPRDDLDPLVARVLDAVPVRRGAGCASIAATAGLDPRHVARALGGLAARGYVERDDDGWRLSAQRR